MTAQALAENLRPAEVLDALIARHGVLRVVLALPTALLKGRGTTRLAQPISPHLARDIGLSHGSLPKTAWEYR